MPDRLNPCRQSEARLRQFDRFMAATGTIGKDNKKGKFIPDRGYETIDISQIDVPTSATTTTDRESPPPKKPRAKESSKHFGVRFRPDLQKWVAEIRVFEWKSVDKKVWLGTFDTEVGAACAVDAARKLLKCQKKRPPNFPCPALSAYAEVIPSHLQLTNITEEGMFKEVTVFVKRKAQEYAAGFCTSKGTTTAVGLREQLVAPQYQVGDGTGSCFQLTSDAAMESRPLFAVPEDDVFPAGSSYGTNTSFGSYDETQLASCDGVMSSQPWDSPPTMLTSLTYSSGPSSCSSEGTSLEDTGSWVHVQPSMWTEEALHVWSQDAQIGDYCLVAPSLEDQIMAMAVPMGMDDQTVIDDMSEYLFDMEEDRECCVGDQAMMNIFTGDEAQQVMYVDNQYEGWTIQQSFNSFSYNSFSNSFENREVC